MKENKLADWLVKEEEWLEKQGLIEDDRWYPKMFEIYRQLIRLAPENQSYRLWLAKYLMDHGTDKKLRYENYCRAKELFEEVVLIDPENGEAQYHLGYLYFMEEYWKKALAFLEQAIRSNALSKQQSIRGMLATAICLHKLHRVDDAEDVYQKAKRLDLDLEHTTEFQFARAQMIDLPEDKPYLVERRNQRKFHVNEIEAYDLIASVSKDHIVIDLAFDQPRFLSEKIAVDLQTKEGQLLKELVLSNYFKTREELQGAVWENRGNPQIVKRYIGSLREKLAPCFDKPMTDVIKTLPGQGYMWNDSNPISIISFKKAVFS